MTTLGDIAALAGRRITAMWRSPAKVIGVLMMPISMVLVLGYLFDGSIALPDGQRYVDYLTAGVAVQVGLACVATSALGIADDLRGGLADRFRSLPIRRSAVLFGHTISELSLVAVGIAATSGIAALLGWRIHASPLSAIAGFALLLLFSYGMLWVGVLIGLSIRGTEAISSTAAMIMVFGSFVSNAFVPCGACRTGSRRSPRGTRSVRWWPPAARSGATPPWSPAPVSPNSTPPSSPWPCSHWCSS